MINRVFRKRRRHEDNKRRTCRISNGRANKQQPKRPTPHARYEAHTKAAWMPLSQCCICPLSKWMLRCASQIVFITLGLSGLSLFISIFPCFHASYFLCGLLVCLVIHLNPFIGPQSIVRKTFAEELEPSSPATHAVWRDVCGGLSSSLLVPCSSSCRLQSCPYEHGLSKTPPNKPVQKNDPKSTKVHSTLPKNYQKLPDRTKAT